jgi:uncharacterized protein HemY
VRATDLTLADLLQDDGRVPEAREVLQVVQSGDGVVADEPVLHRLLGRQYLTEGRTVEARSALNAGIDAARRSDDRLEEALVTDQLAALDRLEGRTDHERERRARQLFEALGVAAPR